MQILDLTCKTCGCEYCVNILKYSVIRYYNGDKVQMPGIECPECGSVSYSERHLDDPWEEE